MFCGPEGGRGCFSLLGREMVKDQETFQKMILRSIFVGLCLDNRVNDVNCSKQSFVLFSHIRNKVSYENTLLMFNQILQIHFCSEQFAREHSDCAPEEIIQGIMPPNWSTNNHWKHDILFL